MIDQSWMTIASSRCQQHASCNILPAQPWHRTSLHKANAVACMPLQVTQRFDVNIVFNFSLNHAGIFKSMSHQQHGITVVIAVAAGSLHCKLASGAKLATVCMEQCMKLGM